MRIIIIVVTAGALGAIVIPAAMDGWRRWVGPTLRNRQRSKVAKKDWDRLILLLDAADEDVPRLERAAQRLRRRED